MQTVIHNGVTFHVRLDGPQDGPAVVLCNSLGTDLRVWDDIVALLPNMRILRFDKRGHGLTDCPEGPYSIQMLADDAAAIAQSVGFERFDFVGLSIGGLIGQQLAHSRPDMVRSLVLMDTAAKIGNDEMWDTRIAAVRETGLAPIADAIMPRWFAKSFSANNPSLKMWRNMLARTPAAGYIACCEAIKAADLTEQTRNLSIPVTTIAGEEDGSTPPDVVRNTANLCGADFHLIHDAGHLPCVEKPAEIAEILNNFIGGQS